MKRAFANLAGRPAALEEHQAALELLAAASPRLALLGFSEAFRATRQRLDLKIARELAESPELAEAAAAAASRALLNRRPANLRPPG